MSYRLARPIRVGALSVLFVAGWMTRAHAVDLVPVEDFARHPSALMPRLSPDGQSIALRVDSADDESSLVIFHLADLNKPASILRMPKGEVPADIEWVSNDRVIVEKGKLFGTLEGPELTGEILTSDLSGKHQDYLYGYQGGGRSTRNGDDGWGFYAGRPVPANGHFYMQVQHWNREDESELDDVNAARNSRHEIGSIGVGGMDFLVDPNSGQAIYAYGDNSQNKFVVYHLENNGGWAPMNFVQSGGRFAPIGLTPDSKRVYASFSSGGGPASLVEQDPNGGNRKSLAASDFGSVGDIQWTAHPSQPFAYALATGVPHYNYIDPSLPAAKLHMAVSQKFPGSRVNFINFSEAGDVLLFEVDSDRDPGTYYLIDTHQYKVRKLFAVQPSIDPTRMAERRPLRFTASDGLPLEAILTLPKGAGETGLPMVLLPHGGPFDIRDDWGYDDLAQFLASRGYLVLQVNFRGSGGRGWNFEHSGYLKWGTRIQQDLINGVQWAIAQKYADPKRVCVFGGSFGGYSAMMTVTRAPGLFRCAVGYAGVYDLAMMYDKGDTHTQKSGLNFLHQTIGTDSVELNANSPDKLADKIDVPVFLVHGEEDQRAPFAQAKAMRAALDAAHKPYEWMAVPGEGHGFYAEKNNIDFLNRLQAFLEKNIGKGAGS